MEHLTLYRQFRPKTFDEVIGQDHIVKTLENQIKNETVGHAYLFCGTRGTGKTSCAKIFAKAVNCLNPKADGSPCGECEICKSVGVNGNLDIIEIDAASNNRVDEIRDLREKVKYFPTLAKYKVYIIDEVHMLTDSAANALLKTLEEPPSYVIFILATTEPEKLPATILSRCMRFDFKLVNNADLVKHLKHIFETTKTKYEDEALELIANAGEGSVRDTLSVAEMCISYCNNNLTYEKVLECLGLTNSKTLESLAESIIQKNGGKVLEILNKLYNEGKNLSNLLKDLSNYFNSLLTIKMVKNANELLNLPVEVYDKSKKIAQTTDEKFLLFCLTTLSTGVGQLKYAINEKINAETTILTCVLDSEGQINEIERRLSFIEQKLSSTELQTKSFEPKEELKRVEEIKPEKTVEIEEIKTEIAPMPTETDEPVEETVNVEIVTEQSAKDKSEKQILGEFVSYLRKNQEMILFENCRYVLETKIDGNNYEIILKSPEVKSVFENSIKTVTDFFARYGLKPILKCDDVVENNKVELLRKKLGNKLIVE